MTSRARGGTVMDFWTFRRGEEEESVTANGLACGILESDPIQDLFSDALATNIGYAQPQPGLALPGTFDSSIIDRNLWAAQALHQHHSTTYQAMVNAKYR